MLGQPLGGLLPSLNLSDVQSAATARHNLGLGTSDAPTFAQLTLSNTPVNPTDAVTKQYADLALQGLQFKGLAWLATTGALTGTPTYDNVAGTLTASNNNILFVDGQGISSADVGALIVVKNEANQAHNGLYVVTQDGDGSSRPYILTRATNMSTGAECNGAFVVVESGAVNQASLWVCAPITPPTGTITLGSTNILWVQVNAAADLLAGTGITISGNTVSVSGAVVQTSRNVNTTAPLTGGGALSGDLTLAISAATDSTAGSMSAADKTKLDAATSAATASTLASRDGNAAAAFAALTSQQIQTTVKWATASSLPVLYPAGAGNITTLTPNVYNNGSSGVGATITAGSNGALVVDGGNPAVNDLILVKNEANAAWNGVYSVTNAGSSGSQWVLTRVATMNSSGQFRGTVVSVAGSGAINANTSWVCHAASSVTVGTTAVSFLPLGVPKTLPFTPFSKGLTQWSPLYGASPVFWMAPSMGYHLWQEYSGSGGVGLRPQIGDPVGSLVDIISGSSIQAGSTGTRVTLGGDNPSALGSQGAYFNFGGSQALQVLNSQYLFSFLMQANQPFTISFKIKASALTGLSTIADQTNGVSSNAGLQLYRNAAKVGFTIYNGVGGGNGPTGGTMASTVSLPDTTNWHTVVIYCDGARNVGIKIDNNNPDTFTMADPVAHPTYYSAANSPASNDLFIGRQPNGSNACVDAISDLVIASANWNASSTTIPSFQSFNPQLSFDPPRDARFTYNSGSTTYDSNGMLSTLGGMGVQTLAPDKIPGLHVWYDFTDPSQMSTQVSGSYPSSLAPNGTHPSSDGDKVAYVESKGPFGRSYNRACFNNSSDGGGSNNQVGLCPRWHTQAAHSSDIPAGLSGCVYWNGTTPTSTLSATENALLLPGVSWPDAPKTWFIVFKSQSTGNDKNNYGNSTLLTNASGTIGSGTISGPYVGVRGPNIDGGGPSTQCNGTYQHFTGYAGATGGSTNSPLVANILDWNIFEHVQEGTTGQHWLNGQSLMDPTNTNCGFSGGCGQFLPAAIGRPGNLNGTVAKSDMIGYIAHIVCYVGVLDPETRRRLRAWFQQQLQVPAVVLSN